MAISLGDISISRVVEMEGPLMEPQMLLPDATAEGMARHKHWLAPQFLGHYRGFSPDTRQLLSQTILLQPILYSSVVASVGPWILSESPYFATGCGILQQQPCPWSREWENGRETPGGNWHHGEYRSG